MSLRLSDGGMCQLVEYVDETREDPARRYFCGEFWTVYSSRILKNPYGDEYELTPEQYSWLLKMAKKVEPPLEKIEPENWHLLRLTKRVVQDRKSWPQYIKYCDDSLEAREFYEAFESWFIIFSLFTAACYALLT